MNIGIIVGEIKCVKVSYLLGCLRLTGRHFGACHWIRRMAMAMATPHLIQTPRPINIERAGITCTSLVIVEIFSTTFFKQKTYYSTLQYIQVLIIMFGIPSGQLLIGWRQAFLSLIGLTELRILPADTTHSAGFQANSCHFIVGPNLKNRSMFNNRSRACQTRVNAAR